jgi:hypothetical protein
MDTILELLKPSLLEFAGTGLSVVVAWAIVSARQTLKAKTGIYIKLSEAAVAEAEARQMMTLRDVLGQAISNGAEAAVRELPGGDSPQIEPLVDFVVNYLRRGVPDTIIKLRANDDTLRKRATTAVLKAVAENGRG